MLFFSFLHKNIRCGYSLEMPQWGASNKYSKHMDKKENIYIQCSSNKSLSSGSRVRYRDINGAQYKSQHVPCMYNGVLTLVRFVPVVVCWDITDKWHSVMLSPYFLIKIGLELLNGIIYNGALCLTSNSNRNQLINYVWKQEIIGLTI